MRPTTFAAANAVLGAPEGRCPIHGVEIGGLPVATDGQVFVSRWEPSPAERLAIAAGAPVWLVVMGAAHPPVELTAGPDSEIGTEASPC